ncbi:LacI family gluconate utilization system Gnt-I transcriptional repressor [Agrobacterium vitis]|nr:LacI family gluconate utilization system Gnt-I transcriptional repressor [Agrobacterium vitis]MBE1436436.1 LacI family gluconate utilization system Gnt-I transcriptional repressor [Agrobacterium vitis]
MTIDLKNGSITLSEVAIAAGVGESTVSRVLRNHGSFSEKTRASVMAAVEQLGYVPNRIAGALASTGTSLVAIVVPSLSNIVFADVLRGATQVLETGQRQAVFAVTEYDLEREEALVAAMLAWRPAAVMVAGFEHTEGTRRMLQTSGCRVVQLLDIDGDPLDLAVGFSNFAAGKAAAEHLLAQGYRKLGYVGHNILDDTRAGKRYAGFCAALEQQGLALWGTEIGDGRSSVGVGHAGLAALLSRHADMEAVYFSNDDMALGGYFHCLSHQIAVPQQVAIFGHNGLDIGRYTPQALTTIQTPRVEAGRVAAQLVLDDAPSQTVDLGFTLIAGATA